MSEEYATPRSYSAFWPLLLILAAFAFSFCYQIVEVISHRNAVNTQYQKEAVNLPAAKDAEDQLYSLLNDLTALSDRDPSAAQIVLEAKQAGISIRPKADDTTTSPTTP